MSNSSLINYTKISPNKTSPRNHIIDTITIHCMAGNATVEGCGSWFAKSSTQASSNYGIGTDGRIALYVDEKDRSWASSNASNDNRAVTIEVANDGDASTGWHVSDKALNSLINLIADICKRNNIKELKWRNDKSLIGQVDKQNMTLHCWFKNKDCPGQYLISKHPYIVSEVNKKLNGLTTTVNNNITTSNTSSNNSKSQTINSLSGTVQVIYKGSDGLNVRETPSMNGKINQVVKYGGVFTVIGISSDGNWYKLKSGLYITTNANYVKFTPSSTSSISTTTTTTTKTNTKIAKPDIVYRVYTNKWLPEVKNNTDYAGLENLPIKGVMIKLSNGDKIKYRVHLKNGNWLGWVDGYSTNDYNNGYAGNLKSEIDAIEIKCDKWDIRYKVSTTSNGTAYYSEVADSQNDYAGVFGRAIDKLMCRIV